MQPSLIVLAGVIIFIFQAINWSYARRSCIKIPHELKKICVNAKDSWGTVMDRHDRLAEPLMDQIRQCANAALVIGVGGTIVLFLVEIPFISIEDIRLADGFASQIAFPLLSSLVGVFSHLVIASVILSEAQNKVTESENEQYLKIQNYGFSDSEKAHGDFRDNPMIDFTGGVDIDQQQVSEWRVEMQNQQKEFSNTLDGFKGAVEAIKDSLGEYGKNLSDVAEATKTSEGVNEGLAQLMEKLNHRLMSLPDDIIESVAGKVGLDVKNATGVLGDSLEGFIDGIREENSKQQKAISDTLDGFKGAVEEIKDSLGEYGKNLTDVQYTLEISLKDFVEKISDGNEEQRDHMRNTLAGFEEATDALKKYSSGISKCSGDLIDASDQIKKSAEINGGYNELMEELNQRLQSLPSEIVNSAAVNTVSLAANELKNSLDGFVKDIKEANQKHYNQITGKTEEIVDRTWKKLQGPIQEDFIEPLSNLRKQLAATVDPQAVSDFGEKLNRAAETLEKIPQKLENVDISRSLEPISDQMNVLMGNTEKVRKDIDNSVKELIKLMEELIGSIQPVKKRW